ncbi:hypothetical protein KC349_g1270 [Hortaea werneckii]|nr:hypothetical protein KC349_g1270 [Hortaea werneckii]
MKNFFAKTNPNVNVEAIATEAAAPKIGTLRSTLRKRFAGVCQVAYGIQDSPDLWSLEATKAAIDQYLCGESRLLGDELPCPAELPLHPYTIHSAVYGMEQMSSGDDGFSDDEQGPSSKHPGRRRYTNSQASEASQEEEEEAGADDEDAEGGGRRRRTVLG